MRTFLLILHRITAILIVLAAGCARITDDPRKPHPVVAYYPDGAKRSEGVFRNTLPNGEFRFYRTDGSLESQGEMADGQPVGRWTFWNPEGGKQTEAEYRDGKPSGEWQTWHDDGKLASISSYKEGKLHGKQLQIGRAHV